MNKDTFAAQCIMYSFPEYLQGSFMVVQLTHSYHLGLLDLHCIELGPFKDKVQSTLLDQIGKTSHTQPALAMKNEF